MNTKIYGCRSEDAVKIEGQISEKIPIDDPSTPTRFTVGGFKLQCGRLLSGDWTIRVITSPKEQWKHFGFHSLETPDDYTECVKLDVSDNSTITVSDTKFTDRAMIE